MSDELTAEMIEWALMNPKAQGSQTILTRAAFAYLRQLNTGDDVEGFIQDLDDGTTKLLKDLNLDG